MICFNRRHFLTTLGLQTVGLTSLGASLLAAPRAFAQSRPLDIDRRLAQAEQSGRVSGLHALLVSQTGKLVFEHYGQGEDESWGQPLGNVVFAADVLHDLRSVSKSVVGLAYGIALAAGKVPPPEAKLYDQFQEYADLAKQPGRDRLTVHHLLSMTLGFDWDELTVPYSDPRNSEIAMENAPDRFRFVLERPMVREPGVKWSYCGGATALLGRLIEKGTGEDLLAYCHRALFERLDFGRVEWAKGRDGAYSAASGARLLPRDLVKIGQLVLAGGSWNGKEIVPSQWVKLATTPKIELGDGGKYGYHWYLGASPVGTPARWQPWIGGIGWGGQRLHVFPELDLVIAFNCGNYAKPGVEQSRIAKAIISEIVLPSFV